MRASKFLLLFVLSTIVICVLPVVAMMTGVLSSTIGNKTTVHVTQPIFSASPTAEESTILHRDSHGITTYTLADDVLSIRGAANYTHVIGKDSQGMIVNWVYSDYVYEMRYWDGAYRVFAIYLV